jgi:hypothetical protein
MKNILSIILGLLALIVGGCAVQPIYKLEPLEEKEYYKGREIVTKEDDSIKVSVEVDNYEKGMITFYVQVENKSCDKIFIEPENFYADAISEDLKSADTLYPRFYAADPEKEIQSISKEMENRKSAHSFVTGANAVLAFLSVAADLTNKRDENKAVHVGGDVAVWAGTQTNENIDYHNSMGDLDSLREYWKNEVLRKTDLYPGEQIGGLVFVYTNPEAKYLKLYIPAGIDRYDFLFKKIMIK